MAEIEIPEYFICPISLQIMKDPVTTTTGITYDRESIEHWLLTAEDATCPVTKQPLVRDTDHLTQNHMLRKLIQGWCTANTTLGIDRIPTPKSPLLISQIQKLHRHLKLPHLYLKTLKKIDLLTLESEKNIKCMVEAGTANVMSLFVTECFKRHIKTGLDEVIKILNLTWTPLPENKNFVKENPEFIEALIWVMGFEFDNHMELKTHALLVLKMVIQFASSSQLERLKHDFFKHTSNVLREKKISKQARKAVLHVLIEVCPWGRNRMKIVEEGAIYELVEIELSNSDKSVSELIFHLLAQLCCCADGREQFLKHAGGISLVAKRTLRVSQATDEHTLQIMGSIARFSATNEVLSEMLTAGAVSKLCMVLQADCEKHLKKKARDILRLHSNVWNNSPCIAVYLLTRYNR